MASNNVALRRRVRALESIKRSKAAQLVVPITGTRDMPIAALLWSGPVARLADEAALDFYRRVAGMVSEAGGDANAWCAPGVVFLDDADLAM